MIDKFAEQILTVLDRPIGGLIVLLFSIIVLSFILT